MQEVILFYNELDVPTRQILESKGAIPTKTDADAKIAIQEMAEYSYKCHNGTSSKARSTETFDGLAAIQARLNNLRREIKKVNEKVYAAWYREAGRGFYQSNNENSSYPDRRQTLEESLTKFMAESAKRHEENSNVIKEIRASTNVAIRNQGASSKTFEIQIGQMSKVLQERRIGGLTDLIEPNPRDHVKSISTAKAGLSEIGRMGCSPYVVSGSQHKIIFSEIVPFPRTLKQPTGIGENVLVRIGKFIFPIDFIILDIPEDNDVPLIVGRPFLSTAHSKIDVYKRKFILRVGEEKLIFKSIKPATSIIRRVFILKDLDLKTKLIREDNESFDPLYGNYIELNDLDTPLEPETNQDV
nr:hypothetical protein [Tanacetum cinerariifolium]